jgi:Polyketide cyclase / dehydrase and lipid transport
VTPTIVILVVVFVLIVALVAFISTRPGSFHIERSAQVSAPPGVVFSIINDLHQWGLWSPWDKLDPNMEKTYSGAPVGPGAVYAWTGNSKVGAGRNTLLESKADEFVSMKLEMFRPFACTNQVTFKLVPAEGGTRVSWIMDGKNNFMGKAVSLFMNMDALVGKNFEEGLAKLNTAAQAEAQRVRQAGP